MTVTVEELARRVALLEKEVAQLKVVVIPPRADETAAQRGKRLLAQVEVDRAPVRAIATKVFAEIGIAGTPLPVEELRRLLLAEGAKPEDNLVSRGIRELREE
jgi:hypothetical protein